MTCSRADHGLSGSIEFNGKVGVSFCISVDAVVKNIDYIKKKKDNGYLPAEYIEASSDPAAASAGVFYRVSLFIRNIGGVLPLEAWVNSYSTKGNLKNSILDQCTIGGFGYGLKDAVLCLFTNQFNHFNVYATDPLGLNNRERGKKSFYRGVIENTRWRHIDAATLCMKVVFHSRLTPENKNVPKIVRTVSSDLPSTVVSMSSVVDASELEDRLKTLIAAVKCHKIFDLHEDLDDFAMSAYLADELGQDRYDEYCRRLKDFSAIRTQASATPVARAKGLQSSVEVYAPCVDEQDDSEATFYTEVTANSSPAAEVSIFTWPGLQLLRIYRSCQGKLGKVIPTGSRFTSFMLRFPNSFKKHTQRDRAYTYTVEIGALLGSSIIAACADERSKNLLSFPDFKSASSLQEVEAIMQIASDTFPLNNALCNTVLDVLKAQRNSNGHDGLNINLDFLACYGTKAGVYLSNFFGSFYPVDDANDQGIATLLHKERTRYCSMNTFGERYFNKIGVPMMVPASLNMLFVQKATDVESSARKFLIRLAALSNSWSPPENSHDNFQVKFNDAVQAEKRIRGISLIVFELEIDPTIVEHFEDNATKLLRFKLTAHEERVFKKARNWKRQRGSESDLEILDIGVEVEADQAILPTTCLLIFSESQNLTLREKIIRICSQGNAFTEFSLRRELPRDGTQSEDDETVSSVCSGSLLSSSSDEDDFLSAVDYTEVIQAEKPSDCLAKSSTKLIPEHNLLPSTDSILIDPVPDSETLGQTRFASGTVQTKDNVEKIDINNGHSCDDDDYDDEDDDDDDDDDYGGDSDGDCDDNESDDCSDNDDTSDKNIKRDDWVANIGLEQQHRDASSVQIKSEKAHEASIAPTESNLKQKLISAVRTKLSSSSDLCECVKRNPGAVVEILEQCLVELPLIDQQAL